MVDIFQRIFFSFFLESSGMCPKKLSSKISRNNSKIYFFTFWNIAHLLWPKTKFGYFWAGGEGFARRSLGNVHKKVSMCLTGFFHGFWLFRVLAISSQFPNECIGYRYFIPSSKQFEQTKQSCGVCRVNYSQLFLQAFSEPLFVADVSGKIESVVRDWRLSA